MYKPNFCAECGERVARLRWHVWTSRRFCDGCDKRYRRGRIARSLAVCAALLCAGFVGGRAMRPAPPPLILERNASNPLPPLAPQLSTAGKEKDATKGARPQEAFGADGTQTERPTDPDEIVSVCGARTKKGTPCSRRVRGTGRCWQHRGRAAILPAAKLIVREQ